MFSLNHGIDDKTYTKKASRTFFTLVWP